jgi:PAP2 superfamily
MARSTEAAKQDSRVGHTPRRDASRRPRLWPELLLLLVCYGAYEMVRNMVPRDHAMAAHRAYEVLHVEYVLNLDVEYGLNRVFVTNEWVAVASNYFYATMHFIVTVGVMVWLYARQPQHYTRYRSLLFATTMLGLVGFWLYPLAPPRMLPGFTDTVISFGTWGIYDSSSPMATISNQYAAMPSMHTAWSLWCAAAIIQITRRRWVRVLAALYPTTTILVIMGTANHFLLDAVGGAAALLVGYVLVRAPLRSMSLALVTRGGLRASGSQDVP